VLPWIFGEKVYNQLKIVHENYPIYQHDMMVSCGNTQFQTLEFTPRQESYYHMSDAMRSLCIEEIDICQRQISNGLGIELSNDELLALSMHQPLPASGAGGFDQQRVRAIRRPNVQEEDDDPPLRARPSRYAMAQENINLDSLLASLDNT
jgi:hypothetical protein